MVTDRFQDVAKVIEDELPDLVCGTQMERHSCRKLDIPCMVVSPPTHIENHLLGYYPFFGFDGADVIADRSISPANLALKSISSTFSVMRVLNMRMVMRLTKPEWRQQQPMAIPPPEVQRKARAHGVDGRG